MVQELEGKLGDLKAERAEQDNKLKVYQLQASHAEAQKVCSFGNGLAPHRWQAQIEAESAALKSQHAVELQHLSVWRIM
jgi:hypothetical protein